MKYKDWIIPAGVSKSSSVLISMLTSHKTAIGMSGLYVCMDPKIFPHPKTFKPERWLDPDAREKLEPYLVTFGKGPRACVGINLANAELYTVIATLLRRFPKMRLYETGPEDVEPVSDFFAGMWRYEEGKMSVQIKT
jgi:hypothetical protein